MWLRSYRNSLFEIQLFFLFFINVCFINSNFEKKVIIFFQPFLVFNQFFLLFAKIIFHVQSKNKIKKIFEGKEIFDFINILFNSYVNFGIELSFLVSFHLV